MAGLWTLLGITALLTFAKADQGLFKRAVDLSQTLEPRVLKAANLESDLSRRGLDIAFRKSILLHYAEVSKSSIEELTTKERNRRPP
jgi:hypothetical protein